MDRKVKSFINKIIKENQRDKFLKTNLKLIRHRTSNTRPVYNSEYVFNIMSIDIFFDVNDIIDNKRLLFYPELNDTFFKPNNINGGWILDTDMNDDVNIDIKDEVTEIIEFFSDYKWRFNMIEYLTDLDEHGYQNINDSKLNRMFKYVNRYLSIYGTDIKFGLKYNGDKDDYSELVIVGTLLDEKDNDQDIFIKTQYILSSLISYFINDFSRYLGGINYDMIEYTDKKGVRDHHMLMEMEDNISNN